MQRLLLIAALAVTVLAVDVGVASAAVSDDGPRCEPGEEALSMLSEARLAAFLNATARPPLDDRCIARFGAPADCQWNERGAPTEPAGSWSPGPRDHWLPPAGPRPTRRAARRGWLDSSPVVLCDGYARALERPPQG